MCNTSLPFCQRCSAALFRFPEGSDRLRISDRLCILDVIDDDKDTLTLEMKTDGRILEIELTDEDLEVASVEGWEALADFDPALFRSGANARWAAIRLLPANHRIELN
jgi:hypothetical protein